MCKYSVNINLTSIYVRYALKIKGSKVVTFKNQSGCFWDISNSNPNLKAVAKCVFTTEMKNGLLYELVLEFTHQFYDIVMVYGDFNNVCDTVTERI